MFSRVLHTLISCRSKDYGAVVAIVSFGFGVALSLTSTFVGHVIIYGAMDYQSTYLVAH